MRNRGFITLPLVAWLAIGGAAVLLLSWGALYIQTQRLDAANGRIAAMVATAEAQDKANKEKAARDARLAKEKDDESKRRYAALDARYERLREQSSRGFLPPVPAHAASPERACFDRAELERALGEFVAEVTGIAETGDKGLTALNIGREWVQALRRETP